MRRIVTLGVAVAALFAVGPATGTSVAGGSPAADSTKADCLGSGHADARLRPGATGTDPNTVTRAQARAMNRVMHARLARMSPAERAAARRGDAPVVIKVYWQVITRADGTGNVSNTRINRQLRVLNDGFGGETAGTAAETRFSFQTQRIIRTANTNWYNWRDPDINSE